MSVIPLSLDDDLFELLRQSPQPVETTVRELIILELHRERRLSGGKASELLGLSRWEFIQKAANAGIAYFDMTDQEWEAEANESESI